MKSKPSDNHTLCLKCNGTGFYCMGTENGKPYSHTGFECYPCHGTGWKLPNKRIKKDLCPTCGLKFETEHTHSFIHKLMDGSYGPVPCKGWN